MTAKVKSTKSVRREKSVAAQERAAAAQPQSILEPRTESELPVPVKVGKAKTALVTKAQSTRIAPTDLIELLKREFGVDADLWAECVPSVTTLLEAGNIVAYFTMRRFAGQILRRDKDGNATLKDTFKYFVGRIDQWGNKTTYVRNGDRQDVIAALAAQAQAATFLKALFAGDYDASDFASAQEAMATNMKAIRQIVR